MSRRGSRPPGAFARLTRVYVTRAVLARECARIALALGVYLALHPLWVSADLRSAYESLVRGAAGALVTRLQHFPLPSSLAGLEIHNLDFAVVLLVALALVVRPSRWRATAAAASAVLVALFVVHVVAVAVQATLTAADSFAAAEELQPLLPWERFLLERLRYLLYDVGVQLLPFVLIGLAAAWNLAPRVHGLPTGSAPTSRVAGKAGHGKRAVLVVVGSVVVLGAILATARRVRESDPRHFAAHARFGDLATAAGKPVEAIRQYRAALAGGSRDPEVYFRLATLLRRQGAIDEARDLLREGHDATTDPAWRERFRLALEASGR